MRVALCAAFVFSRKGLFVQPPDFLYRGDFSGKARYVYDPVWGHTMSFSTIEANKGEAYTNSIVDGAGRLRLFVAAHPGSVGTYWATQTVYDKMGRVAERASPTEIYGNGVPAGDDAAAGYQWTKQAYDWQGRPTLTTYPLVAGQTLSNSTRLSYGGCGCAGGEVTTASDERGREKRYTKDGLGRLAKVEELDWDANVYSTTDYTYNGRDQITAINQQGLSRTFQYDGHGRLWKRTTPEQGVVEYAYNADDTAAWMKDARGVKTIYTYNSRHLPERIEYNLSGVAMGQNVAATETVLMGYDAAGNRTSMQDGLGSATYVYDTQSRLTSETRAFTGVDSYTHAYEYNLAGQLARITSPWGIQVAYARDAVGQVTDVLGTNAAGAATYMGVEKYAKDLKYRAFGAVKSMTYHNGKTLATQFDARLRLKRWDVAGVLGYDYSYDKFAENSFRVTYAQNISHNGTAGGDATLNRSYDYDHAGRLWEAHAGNEADAHANGTQWPSTPNGPYSHSYRYDQYGNQIYRVGWGGFYGSYLNQYQTFTNNRRDGLTYDLAGNLTNDGAQYTYDATGQQTNGVYPAGWGGHPNYTLTQAYDGDGLRAKKVDNGVTTYSVRSSALGGAVVADIKHVGGVWTASRGYVYGAGGGLLALLQSGVQWVHSDPVTKGQRLTNASGAVVSTVDLDPWGGETARANNSLMQPRKYTSYERDGSGSDQAMFRQYHGAWARFDQPDPWDGSYSPSDPQSLNRYAYTQNDPVNFVDPAGLLRLVEQPDLSALLSLLFGRWELDAVAPEPDGVGGGGGGGVPALGPENTGQTPAPNPNCMQNAVPGSPGLARRFGPGHDGSHTRAPAGGGVAVTLAPLAGTVINITGGGDGTNIVDVRTANGDVAIYKDLGRVFVSRGTRLGADDRIGTVSGGGFGGFSGLHLSIVHGGSYRQYRQLTGLATRGNRAQQAQARSDLSRLQSSMLIDPLGAGSPVNCPGVSIIDIPVRGGVPTTYPLR